MPGTAAEAYRRKVDAAVAQRERLLGRPGQDIWADMVDRFRQDPRRQLDGNARAIAAYLRPADVLVDVGGGAGRLSLPLAYRCRNVVNVDPSPSMADAFEASARESGIINVRVVRTDWLSAEDVEGDVTLTANVTYFVQDIEAFVSKLAAASRRRVIVAVSTDPPANRARDVFRLVFGEDLALAPSYRDLISVLWEMDIVPDVRVLGQAGFEAERRAFGSREEATEAALRGPWFRGANREAARLAIEQHFDELFRAVDGHCTRALSEPGHLLLITWRTDRNR